MLVDATAGYEFLSFMDAFFKLSSNKDESEGSNPYLILSSWSNLLLKCYAILLKECRCYL